MHPGSFCSTLLVAVCVAQLAHPSPAQARSLQLQSHTLATAGGVRPVFGAADSRSQVLLLEIVQLTTEDVGLQGLGAEVSGLAGGEVGPDAPLVDPATEGNRFVGSLLVGLARWRSAKNALSITAGRQYLFAGAGRAEHLDGLAVTYRSPWHVDLSVFGGRTTPWQLDLDEPDPAEEPWYSSNYAAGGRIGFRLLERAVATVGFLHEGDASETVRQAFTFDVGYWGFRAVEALAGGIVDTVERKPQEIWVQLISRPLERLKLGADYVFQIPALAIPKTSIFSVFASETEYHSAALTADYGLTPWLTVGVEGGVRLFPDEDEPRIGYTVAASARMADSEQRLVGAELELLEIEDERQVSSRLFGLYHLPFGLYTSVDLHLLWFDVLDEAGASVFTLRRTDNPFSLGGLLLLGYRFTPALSAQLAGSAFVTPAAKRDLRLFARFTYEGTWGSR